MAKIEDKGTYIQLILEPGLKSVEQIDKPEEGYEAMIGLNNLGRHMISYVNYAKEFINSSGNQVTRTIQDVLTKIDDLKNCQRCSTLDKENLNVDSITLTQPQSSGFVSTNSPTDVIRQTIEPVSQQVPTPANQKSIKDMFADQFFNAYFTSPGKFVFGTLLGDEQMMSDVMPTNEKEQNAFIGEVIDYMTGDASLIRSPDEAKDFLSVMKQDNNDSNTPKTKRSNVRLLPTTVIY